MTEPFKRATKLVIAAVASTVLGLGAARAAEQVGWKSTTDLGLVNTAGNVSMTTLNAGEQVSYKAAPWSAAGLFSIVYGRLSGETTTSAVKLQGRADYEIDARLSVYGLAGFDRNRFAGISRRFEQGAGLSYKAWTGANDSLVLDAGVSLTEQRTTVPVSDTFAALRLAGSYKHMLAEKAYFLQTVEVLPSLADSSDLRVNSETALVAPVSKSVSLKASYLIHFDNLPVPGFKKTDRILTTGLQINF